MNAAPVRVLVVEDSPIALTILVRILSTAKGLEVVGTARNGRQALSLIPQLEPAVICTDFFMKGMDGLELTRQVMAYYPRPILVLSVIGSRIDAAKHVLELREAGVVDVMAKPASGLPADYEKLSTQLIEKIRILAGVKVLTKPLSRSQKPLESKGSVVNPVSLSKSRAQVSSPRFIQYGERNSLPYRIVAIGASTGGPNATYRVLMKLPPKFPLPIVCVQHISTGFLAGLVNWLNRECALTVKIAIAGESPKPGYVYYAPEERHLELDSQGRFKLLDTPQREKHRPSISTLFEAIARVYGETAVGVLLTGMGRDGAAGLNAIATAGGLTVAQDEASSVVFGMPKEAIEMGAAQEVLAIDEIGSWLGQQIIRKRE
ncbi:MAG: chemotaxis-specific protein-glutamate methyltransferase CheB [Cyanobacteria bacterium P01_H01_bin.15]